MIVAEERHQFRWTRCVATTMTTIDDFTIVFQHVGPESLEQRLVVAKDRGPGLCPIQDCRFDSLEHH